jgi:integrase
MRQGYYLRQRKNGGSFHVIFVDPITGKQTDRTSGTNDEKRANAIAQGWLSNGVPDKPKVNNVAKQMLFCDYPHQFWDFVTSDYFRELETMGKEPHVEHAQEMQKAVERYYRPYFQSKLLCQIDEESLQKFIVHLKLDKKLAASTVNSARNVALVALRHAKRKKIIQHFDFDAVLRAGGKAGERGILERDEVDKLFSLDWPSPRSRMAVLIAANTGMRMGEVRALRVCDVHEDRISVRHSWGRKSNLKCTKNQETREIPILTTLHDEIMVYIRQMGLYNLDSFLLPGDKPEIPYNNRQIGKDFNKMLEKIGIEKVRKERGIVFHSWRHLLAKNLAEKGIIVLV